MCEVRYHAFGGPELIAACEYVARSAEGAELVAVRDGRAAQWLAALDLSRASLTTLLVLEDAWRELVTALGAGADDI